MSAIAHSALSADSAGGKADHAVRAIAVAAAGIELRRGGAGAVAVVGTLPRRLESTVCVRSLLECAWKGNAQDSHDVLVLAQVIGTLPGPDKIEGIRVAVLRSVDHWLVLHGSEVGRERVVGRVASVGMVEWADRRHGSMLSLGLELGNLCLKILDLLHSGIPLGTHLAILSRDVVI